MNRTLACALALVPLLLGCNREPTSSLPSQPGAFRPAGLVADIATPSSTARTSVWPRPFSESNEVWGVLFGPRRKWAELCAALGDVNGNGKLDIIAANTFGLTMTVLLNP